MDFKNFTMLKREIFEEEHEVFRQAFRTFCEREVVPRLEEWEKEGQTSRDVWKKAGDAGFLCPCQDEKYGGSNADFLYPVVIIEELTRCNAPGFMISLHSDICAPYIESYGTEEQKMRWLPGCASGDKILAVAMTEPGAGSDLQAIRTTAIRDGDQYVINGQKTFISNGQLNDICIVAAKTDPKADPAYTGLSLLVVEAGTPGYTKGRRHEKIGLHSQDTSELYFEDCRVPADNLLGSEGGGFVFLMQKLQQERLVCAIGAQSAAETVLDWTIEYVKEREAFGRPLSKFQNTRFKLVECASEIQVGRAFIDRLILEHMKGTEVIKETCMAKYWNCEMLNRVADTCLQLFGGYGYMTEYPISKAFVDARIQTIYAGTSEIMKEVVARQMGL